MGCCCKTVPGRPACLLCRGPTQPPRALLPPWSPLVRLWSIPWPRTCNFLTLQGNGAGFSGASGDAAVSACWFSRGKTTFWHLLGICALRPTRFPKTEPPHALSGQQPESRWGSLCVLHWAFLLALFLNWLCVFLDHALHGGTAGPVHTPAGPRALRWFICSLVCSAVRRTQPPLLQAPTAQMTPP